jgi:hypothetical protein
MKSILKFLYRIFLMSYIEPERYYKELVDDVYENDISIILKQIENENNNINIRR